MIELNLTFFVQIANFLILMVVLDRILIKPVLRLLDERKAAIDGAFKEAHRLNEEARAITEEIERKLDETRHAIEQERQRAYLATTREMGKILHQAEEEARRMIERREEELVREAEQAWDVIKSRTDELADRILRRLLAA